MKSREQMPRSAELDSPRRVIVSCSWDTSTSADEGAQGGRACVWGGRGGRLARLPRTCPSRWDHPARFTPGQTRVPPAAEERLPAAPRERLPAVPRERLPAAPRKRPANAPRTPGAVRRLLATCPSPPARGSGSRRSTLH